MKTGRFIVATAIVVVLSIVFLPRGISEIYIMTERMTRVEAEWAYQLALRAGAKGLMKNGSEFTLRTAPSDDKGVVTIAITCIDFFTVAFTSLLPFVFFVIALIGRSVSFTARQLAGAFIIILLMGRVMNVVRIAVTVGLANDYYPSLVEPIGWSTFHDSIAIAVFVISILIWFLVGCIV